MVKNGGYWKKTCGIVREEGKFEVVNLSVVLRKKQRETQNGKRETKKGSKGDARGKRNT